MTTDLLGEFIELVEDLGNLHRSDRGKVRAVWVDDEGDLMLVIQLEDGCLAHVCASCVRVPKTTWE